MSNEVERIGLAAAAPLLGKRPSTLRQLCRDGVIPSRYAKREGRDWRILVCDEVKSILARRKPGPKPKIVDPATKKVKQ